MSTVQRALSALDVSVLRPLAGFALLAMMLATSLNVISRGVFDAGLGWVVPFVVSLAMPVAIFAGLPSLTLADGHVRMEAISGRVGQKAQRTLRQVGWAVGILVFVYMGVANVEAAWNRRAQGVNAESVLPAWAHHGLTALSAFWVAVILLVYLVRPSLLPQRSADGIESSQS